MKANYIKPQSQTWKIEVRNILAGSPELAEGGERNENIPEENVAARENTSFWDTGGNTW